MGAGFAGCVGRRLFRIAGPTPFSGLLLGFLDELRFQVSKDLPAAFPLRRALCLRRHDGSIDADLVMNEHDPTIRVDLGLVDPQPSSCGRLHGPNVVGLSKPHASPQPLLI